MATTNRTSAATDAEAVAGRIREADFVHLLVRADGASLAAAGLLARACVSTERPYQASVVRTGEDVQRRTGTGEDATVVSVGLPGANDVGLLGGNDTMRPGSDDSERPGTDKSAQPDANTSNRRQTDGSNRPGRDASELPAVTAFEAADALDADPNPALALAGVVADGARPEADAPSILDRAGFERRPGIVAPTTDLADALAHTTLVHAPYSGDPAAAEEVVAGISNEGGGDDADRGVPTRLDRRVASVLAIDAVTAEGASDRAAEAIGRAIRPLAGGPVETVGGYADVLHALAASAPGLAVALALGSDTEPALDVWRAHARTAHEGVRSAETARYGSLLVAHTDGPVESVARLLRDFRSPEPAVLAIGHGEGQKEAALATVNVPADPITSAAEAAGGSGLARGTGGYARFDADREDDLVDVVREAR